jgi:23S rRNA (guanine2535-N1)-methyltransferase
VAGALALRDTPPRSEEPMPYRFVQERGDYAAFASGQVLQSLPGRTAFPVRLASEIFQRCATLLAADGAGGPYTLYDPCCGGAHLLTTLAFLHGDRLARVFGSDIDAEAVELAGRNLALLTTAGLDARIAALAALRERHGKASHAEALAHATTLRAALAASRLVPTEVFVADATGDAVLVGQIGTGAIDLVIADIPYGRQSAWQATGLAVDPTIAPSALLAALLPMLATPAIVAIAANRGERSGHPAYRRVAQLQLGKRQVVFLMPGAGA